jgi:hypothetical protein
METADAQKPVKSSTDGAEATMKHPSVRELYDYWNARRGLRTAPERADIEPGAIRRALADTFILASDIGAGHSFRIAGTRLCAAFGRELRGAAFIDLWDQDSRGSVRDLIGTVARECIGVVAGAGGRSAEGTVLDFELLLLPLLHRRTSADARVLGALAPLNVPYWFGMNPIGRLSLGTMRYLGDHFAATEHGTEPLPPGGRIRHGFVVYDGGQG